MDELRPRPDALMLSGALCAIAGYLLPWFKRGDGYLWSYSGWSYADLSSGGGWTLVTFAWLALALGAALWAGRYAGAAMTGIVAAAGTLVTAGAVVAASFGQVPEESALNPIADLPFGVGLPLLGLGVGLLLAGGCRATVRALLRDARVSGIDDGAGQAAP